MKSPIRTNTVFFFGSKHLKSLILQGQTSEGHMDREADKLERLSELSGIIERLSGRRLRP